MIREILVYPQKANTSQMMYLTVRFLMCHAVVLTLMVSGSNNGQRKFHHNHLLVFRKRPNMGTALAKWSNNHICQ